jgi:hypothetical protein
MGRLNMRALLRRLQQMGTASRADLAKSLGMSQPTAGRIVDQLLELGVLEELSEQQATEAVRTGTVKSSPEGGLANGDATGQRELFIVVRGAADHVAVGLDVGHDRIADFGLWIAD